MKTSDKIIRMLSIALLILLGIGAVYGGVTLVVDPTGELLGLPLYVLDDTPFVDFMIPAVILFLFIGLLSFAITFMTVKKYSKYEWMIVFQGLVLGIWLTTEIIMGIFDPFFHYTYYTVSILLIIFGSLLAVGKNRFG